MRPAAQPPLPAATRRGRNRLRKIQGQARAQTRDSLLPGIALRLRRRPGRAEHSSWARRARVGRRTFFLFRLFSRRLSREEEGGPPLQRSGRVAEERAQSTLLLLALGRTAVGVGSAAAGSCARLARRWHDAASARHSPRQRRRPRGGTLRTRCVILQRTPGRGEKKKTREREKALCT